MTTYNGYTNYETWNFMMWEGDMLQDWAQDLQDEQEKKIEYGQVYEMVNGHIDQMIEELNITSGFAGDMLSMGIQRINIHEISEKIYEEIELEIYYVVDLCDSGMDAIEEHFSLDSVKDKLDNLWSDKDDEEECGWTYEEIEAMNFKELQEALGGVGYALFDNENDALEQV